MFSAVRSRLLLGLFVLAVGAPVAMGPRTALAHVFTDQLDYAPGSTVIISGDNSDDAGYLPAETVLVDVSGPNGYAAFCEGIVDLDGAWSCAVVLADSSDAIGTYVYTATGLDSGVFESGMFTDATLTLFEDAGLTIQRNAFAWGATVHAGGTALIANRCARIEWKKPDATLAEPAHQIVASGGGTITDSFTVPSTGPSGIWTATLQQGSTVGTCVGSSFTTVGQSIQIFDVARVVIIGAGSPSTLVADNPGGDNFVDQQPAQINTVQGGGVGNTLNVLSRASAVTSLNQRTFLQFDLTGAGIPAIASITDAKLRLRPTKSPTGCSVPRTYDLHTNNAAWSEGTITWNTGQPAPVGTPSSLAFSTIDPMNPYLRFGVTDHVEDFVDGSLANNGWRLKDRTEDFLGTGCDSRFSSTEANATQKSIWPVLLIDYELEPLVTNSSLCTFDVNEDRDGDQFRLIFTPDQPNSTSTSPRWKLNASNPGQFYFNVFVVGTPDEEETITLTLPYPFVTKGAGPVHVFDGVTVLDNGEICLLPGNAIEASASPATVALSDYTGDTIEMDVTFTFPSSGFAYIAVHLDYGLKHVAAACFPDNKTDVNVTCDLPPPPTLIPNYASYDFSFSDGQSGTVTVENENVVKNDPGIAGLVTRQDSADPVANVRVDIYDGKGKKVATVYTDADGWYQWTFKYTGKPATFVVKLPDYGLQKSVTLKSNAYVVVNFTVP